MITITNYYSDDKIHFDDESRCIAYEYVLKQYKTKDDFIKAMEDFANEKFNESDEYEILISFDCWDMSSAPYNNAYFMNFSEKSQDYELDREEKIEKAYYFVLDDVEKSNFREVMDALEQEFNLLDKLHFNGEWSK